MSYNDLFGDSRVITAEEILEYLTRCYIPTNSDDCENCKFVKQLLLQYLDGKFTSQEGMKILIQKFIFEKEDLI